MHKPHFTLLGVRLEVFFGRFMRVNNNKENRKQQELPLAYAKFSFD